MKNQYLRRKQKQSFRIPFERFGPTEWIGLALASSLLLSCSTIFLFEVLGGLS